MLKITCLCFLSRILRFCDYNGIISNAVGDTTRGSSYPRDPFGAYGRGPLPNGYCTDRVNTAQIRPLLDDIERQVRSANILNDNLNNPGLPYDRRPYDRRPYDRRPIDGRYPYNDPYNDRNRPPVGTLGGRKKRQTGGSRIIDPYLNNPRFSVNHLGSITQVRVCRCDYDRCNSASSFSSTTTLVLMCLSALVSIVLLK